ncbi:MAG: Lrp/AsnC family transcriptional regulator [Gemmatimonadetes bacterium]|nr:MAG: Lrp/AsnC family transcriptional regulator [Gemmatimonadota bacterium]
MIKLDNTDRQILSILQENGRITNAQLAAEVGLAPTTVLERVRKMERNGVIQKYVALLDPEKVNRAVTVFVSITLGVHAYSSIDAFLHEVENIREVMACYHVAGDADFLLKVCVKDIQTYEDLLLAKLTQINGIQKIHSTFVLSTKKNETRFYLPSPEQNSSSDST